MIAPLLQLSGVTVIRDHTRILDDLSLTIPRGHHTAILGPNGSGKSSLLKLLTRHFYPSVTDDGQQGTVEIFGNSLFELSELRRQMGIVSTQLDFEFSEGRTGRMTAQQAVASGINATTLQAFGPKWDAATAALVERALKFVQLESRTDQALRTMSTGERRRVLIARAMVHQPAILVLDEPTSGLDVHARSNVLEMIDRSTSGQEIETDPMTLLLVTHHIEEIAPGIDHVILLDQGRVVFDGDKREGLTSPRLSQLFGIDLDIRRDDAGWYHATLE